jgi:hypothetical protein
MRRGALERAAATGIVVTTWVDIAFDEGAT